jgi:hypothetical protein
VSKRQQPARVSREELSSRDKSNSARFGRSGEG